MKHLRYCLYSAHINCDITAHPQQTMHALGIKYQAATPQSLGEQWWFWNCENIPEPLPQYLTELTVDPYDAIGWGLSKEQTDAIHNKVSLEKKPFEGIRVYVMGLPNSEY